MRVLLTGLLFVMLALAGCTGDDMPDDGDGGASGTRPAGEDHSETHHISIEDFDFATQSLTITQGDTVVWTNNDGRPHTVASDDGSFDSGNLDDGATFEFTFDDAGTFAYHCGYHASMTGEIVVESLAAE